LPGINNVRRLYPLLCLVHEHLIDVQAGYTVLFLVSLNLLMVKRLRIGGQLFAHDNSQRDCTAFRLPLDTYTTCLLAQALSCGRMRLESFMSPCSRKSCIYLCICLSLARETSRWKCRVPASCSAANLRTYLATVFLCRHPLANLFIAVASPYCMPRSPEAPCQTPRKDQTHVISRWSSPERLSSLPTERRIPRNIETIG
jgi:hypothetical protein